MFIAYNKITKYMSSFFIPRTICQSKGLKTITSVISFIIIFPGLSHTYVSLDNNNLIGY